MGIGKSGNGRSINEAPDFLLIFPNTATHRTAAIACEFTDSILSEIELQEVQLARAGGIGSNWSKLPQL
jgi:hypothetical protein